LAGRLEAANEECMRRLRRPDRRTIESDRRLCSVVWRNQGRYADAAGLVFAGRLPDGGRLAVDLPRDPVVEAVLDLESGRPAAALRTLDRLASDARGSGAMVIWNLIRRGTAAAMGHELHLARVLADSAEAAGRECLSGVDRQLHFFVRGLIAGASGDHATAVDLYRRSIVSPTFGLTRANYEMGKSLLALGRSAEAVPVLEAALRGGWDGPNLYVTRTELHELLARAFEASGRRDSAAVHFALVEQSWRNADQSFAPRYRAAKEWLARR
jgi:tetratricopeptide (TPR) repeat protein